MRFYLGTFNTIVALLALLVSSACASAPPPAKLVQSTIRVDSNPHDALVMLCQRGDFVEENAECIGTTPLMRYRPICEAGSPVRLIKSGYHEWNGTLSPESPEIAANLQPYTQDELEQCGAGSARSSREMKIVPVRVGIRSSNDKSNELETSNDATDFSQRFITAFQEEIRKRFGERTVLIEDDRFANTEYWAELEDNLKEIGIDKLGYHPLPPHVSLSHDFAAALKELGGPVLLIRAEASYLTEGEKGGRIFAALALTAASVAVGYNNPVYSSTGGGFRSDYIIYTVHQPSLSGDSILAQLFLLNGTTSEVLWFGQVAVQNNYKRESVVEQIAQQAAEQIPSSFLKESPTD